MQRVPEHPEFESRDEQLSFGAAIAMVAMMKNGYDAGGSRIPAAATNKRGCLLARKKPSRTTGYVKMKTPGLNTRKEHYIHHVALSLQRVEGMITNVFTLRPLTAPTSVIITIASMRPTFMWRINKQTLTETDVNEPRLSVLMGNCMITRAHTGHHAC